MSLREPEVHVKKSTLLLISALVAATGLHAQGAPANGSVVAAAARALRSEIPQEGVVFERRALCRSREHCDQSGLLDQRSATDASRIASELRAEVGSKSETLRCASRQPSSCSLSGKNALVALSDPEVDGNGATVLATVWRTSSSTRQPVTRVTYLIHLQRTEGRWGVRALEPTSVS